jgi:adenine/guanine phosphoribosyltransferase-like PRPP-binding protein
MNDDAKRQLILDSISGVPDYPKPGILFWDVTTVLLNPEAFQATIDLFVARYKDMKLDVVAGRRSQLLMLMKKSHHCDHTSSSRCRL